MRLKLRSLLQPGKVKGALFGVKPDGILLHRGPPRLDEPAGGTTQKLRGRDESGRCGMRLLRAALLAAFVAMAGVAAGESAACNSTIGAPEDGR